MHRLCVVVANASIARLFDRNSDTGALVPLATLQHPQSRLKGSELADDRPGHEATDRSSGGNRFEPRTDVRRHEHVRFAHQIAGDLDTRLAAGEFDSLWILASSPFLGELKAQLSDGVAKRVQLAQAVDLTSLGLADIEERVRSLRHGTKHAQRAPG
jgi:protein required for attachment to host cells